MTTGVSTKKDHKLKVLMLCKRHYTNRDLITQRFGRLFHLPFQLAKNGVNFVVVTADYKSNKPEKKDLSGVGVC